MMKKSFRIKSLRQKDIDKTINDFNNFHGPKELLNAGYYPLAWTDENKVIIREGVWPSISCRLLQFKN
jgi:hypothetical protein